MTKAELDELIKKAQKEPGIVELSKVYGNYEELLKKSSEYLAGVCPNK